MKSLQNLLGLVALATLFSSSVWVSASPSLDPEVVAMYERNTFPRSPSSSRSFSHSPHSDAHAQLLDREGARAVRRALAKREFSLITENDVLKSYDYVIAGGGLAGLVLASRLSEDSGTSVLVLEAGMSGDEVKDRVDPPAGAYYTSIVGTDYDWQHVTEPQPNLNNRDINWPRGKILGGSTAMNAMYLVRPSRTELDAWSQLLQSSQDADVLPGASRWTWDTLFDAMKRSENFTAPTEDAWEIGGRFPYDAANHGSGGPMSLSYPRVMFGVVGNWTGAVGSVVGEGGGGVQEHPNGGETMGAFISPSSINPTNLTRSYSRPAYIDSLPPRSNLHILSEATVTKVGWSEGVRGTGGNVIANSVEFAKDRDSTRWVVGVDKEVVLAGGPLGSPKVLMHSGVGPADVLGQIGLGVTVDLPGVGQHLQDHLTAGVVWESRVETAGDVRAAGADFSRSSEFLSFINDAVAFLNASRLFDGNAGVYQQEILSMLDNATSTIPSSSPEVLEGFKAVYNLTATTFWESSAQVEMLMSVISPGQISIQSALQHPYSRGRVYINSTDPFDPIVIDPQYFTHPADRVVMRQGVKLVRLVGAALGDALGTELVPGPGVTSDEDIDAWLTRSGANTQYHPASSCSMLPRKWGGVVDGDLRVYGTENVRVVDSSVYPYEFAAHLASVTFGLGEVAVGVLREGAFEVPQGAKVDEGRLGAQGRGNGASGMRGGLGGLVAAVVVGSLSVMF